MTTDIITINQAGEGMKEALNRVEGLANVNSLSERDSLRLRLLAEEALGMVRGMTGDFHAVFWGEEEGGQFSLHMEAAVNADKAEDLKSVATVPEEFKKQGVMNKIRSMVRASIATGAMMTSVKGVKEDVWSLKSYIAETAENKESDAKQEQYDELEKSVVAKLADDVTVTVKNGRVRMVIYKRF